MWWYAQVIQHDTVGKFKNNIASGLAYMQEHHDLVLHKQSKQVFPHSAYSKQAGRFVVYSSLS